MLSVYVNTTPTINHKSLKMEFEITPIYLIHTFTQLFLIVSCHMTRGKIQFHSQKCSQTGRPSIIVSQKTTGGWFQYGENVDL